MNVSPDALRKEVMATLTEVNDLLENHEKGSPSRAPLLLAKTECLSALVRLNEQRKR